jgi:hypothetical protein
MNDVEEFRSQHVLLKHDVTINGHAQARTVLELF